MMILDKALLKREQAGQPIRIGMIGAGYMGRGIAEQLLTPLAGMRLVAIANHRLEGARMAFADAGVEQITVAHSTTEVEAAVAAGRPVIAEDPLLLCAAEGIDAIIEVTGHVESAAHVVMRAIAAGKHVVLMNAELDATIGPILKVHADRAGVILTNTEGDEPGVAMNLYRFVETIGYRPVMAGNIKGFYDPYRTPATQQGFADSTGQKSPMVTSFADGTKLSMETTLLANATGLKVGRRGMFGHKCAHVKDVLGHFQADDLLRQPLVEFVLGAEPGTGAFVVGYNDRPAKQKYMKYFKMGEGPLYVFYTPFHLPHLEVAVTVGRAVLFQDAAVAPLGAPVCDVVTVAKRDLKAGELLDGVGGYTCYGMIENAEVAGAGRLLPMGLSVDCRMVRDVAKDEVLTYDDVALPVGRLCDRLRAEQDQYFSQPAQPPQVKQMAAAR